jgi:DegV family protein with EDD domain
LIRIVTDSMNYLPADLVAQHRISVVPITLLMGQKAYREGVDIDTETFFEMMSYNHHFPTTSQPTPQDFVSVWRPLLEAGHQVITILVSGRLSSTLETAKAAAKSFAEDGLTILDSSSVAMGLGMQVLRAAELAQEGLLRAGIVEVVQRIREALQIVFTLDTLEYLHRGGRINTAKAWLGTLLRVKPLLSLQEGVLEPLEQVRTTRHAHDRLLELTEDHLRGDRYSWIAVMHSRAAESAQMLLDVLRTRFPQARFFCSEIGPVLGAHLGPGGVGIICCPSLALKAGWDLRDDAAC